MEIKINNILLQSQFITGLVGNYQVFIDLFKKEFTRKTIYIDNKKSNIMEKKNLVKKISFIDKNISVNNISFTVYEYMKYNILDNFLSLKDYKKKIKDSLKIVGLTESYLEKKINLLSYLERKFVILATALLSNPDILIFDSFCEGIDLKNRKKIMNLVNQLSEKYKKIVIFCSNDSEFIYRNTKKIILCTNANEFLCDNTNTMYEEQEDLLIENNISIPKTIIFTNAVLKEKGIKLSYNKDIRDLIKDIYKKV